MRFNPTVYTTSRLSCVWIETGNPRNPLACIWIDAAMTAFRPKECEPTIANVSCTAA